MLESKNRILVYLVIFAMGAICALGVERFVESSALRRLENLFGTRDAAEQITNGLDRLGRNSREGLDILREIQKENSGH